MAAARHWEVSIRALVSDALSPRGCRRGWTVLNHRGHVRLNTAAGAGGGRRRQVLLRFGSKPLTLAGATPSTSAAAATARTTKPSMQQCQRAGQILGVRLMLLLDVADEGGEEVRARLHRFYAAMGLKPLPGSPERLFLSVASRLCSQAHERAEPQMPAAPAADGCQPSARTSSVFA